MCLHSLKILHRLETLQKKYHRLQDSSCNPCSLLRGCAIHTHTPAAHVLAKQDHCSPHGTHQASPSRCGILPSGVLTSDGLNSYAFPGIFRKIPAQVLQITTPPIKVSSNTCHQGLFLQLQVSKFCFVT